MEDNYKEITESLLEIKEILQKIFICYEEEYKAIQQRKQKIDELNSIIKGPSNMMFKLLFDPNHLNQRDIARICNISQPTVSRCIDQLISQGFIEPIKDEENKITYIDKFNLLQYI